MIVDVFWPRLVPDSFSFMNSGKFLAFKKKKILESTFFPHNETGISCFKSHGIMKALDWNMLLKTDCADKTLNRL